MAFYVAEELSIQKDEEDNELLKELIRNYKQLQIDYESSKLETQQLKHQIAALEQCNAQLLKELEQLEAKQQNLNYLAKQKATISSKPYDKGYLSMPLSSGFLRDSNPGLQHTKRRISSELQLNDELLRREKKLLEETRRSLSLSNQELSSVRTNLREAEGQLAILNCENRQLRLQIETQRQINGQMWMGNVGKDKMKNEWNRQLTKMDEIYRNIERELTLDSI